MSLAAHWACDLALADIPLPAFVPEVLPYVEPVDPATVAELRADLHCARRDGRMLLTAACELLAEPLPRGERMRERADALRRVVARVTLRLGG